MIFFFIKPDSFKLLAEIEDQQSSSSSVSSSPFELCEIITETTALVESGNNKGTVEEVELGVFLILTKPAMYV